MIQEMVNQLLTIAERMAALVQDLTPVERATPAYGGNGFFAAFAHRDSFAGEGRQTAPTTGRYSYQQSVGHALRAEYERAERAERELAKLRAQQAKDKDPQGRKRPQRPPSKYVAKDNRPSKRLQREQGDKSTPVEKGKAKVSICTICNGPHSPKQCDWKRDHCYRCGKPGHLRYTCRVEPPEAPPAPRTKVVDSAAAQRRILGDSLPRNCPIEEDPSEEDPREDDPEEEDPEEDAPDEEGPNDDHPTRANREGPGSGSSPNPRPVIRFFGRGPYNFSAEDAQSRNGD